MGEAQSKVHWQKDEEVSECNTCQTPFSLGVRRHHCRNCGYIFCATCCSYECAIPMRDLHKPTRVCHSCYQTLTGRIIRSRSNSAGAASQGNYSSKSRQRVSSAAVTVAGSGRGGVKNSSSATSRSSYHRMTESVAARTSLLLRSGLMDTFHANVHGGASRCGKHDARANHGVNSSHRDVSSDAFCQGARSECGGAAEASCTSSAALVRHTADNEAASTTQRSASPPHSPVSGVHHDIYDIPQNDPLMSETAAFAPGDDDEEEGEAASQEGCGYSSRRAGVSGHEAAGSIHALYAPDELEEEEEGGDYRNTEATPVLLSDAAHTRWRDEEARLAQSWALVRQHAQFVDILVQRVERVEPDSVVEYSREVENITLQPEMSAAMAARTLLPLPVPEERSGGVLCHLDSSKPSSTVSAVRHSCESRAAVVDDDAMLASCCCADDDKSVGGLVSPEVIAEEAAKVLGQLERISTGAAWFTYASPRLDDYQGF